MNMDVVVSSYMDCANNHGVGVPPCEATCIVNRALRVMPAETIKELFTSDEQLGKYIFLASSKNPLTRL
jgi:hypothetical protein